MPIYAYRCEVCGHTQDALQKISDAPLTECGQCHAQALKKQVTAAGFQLKGSGWYATDFRNGNKPAASKSDEGASKAATESAPADGGSKGEAAPAKSESGASSSSTPASSASCAPGCGCH